MEKLDLIGHKSQRAHLYKAWKKGKIAHAWLFIGPKGIGKFSLARSYAQFIVKPSPQNSLLGDESDEFPFQQYSFQDETPNIRIIHPDISDENKTKDITIEAIRQIQQYLRLTTMDGNWKIIIIDEASRLNRNAANALLKILEDPPQKTLFFLIAHNLGKLPVTIRSRCQKLRFHPVDDENILAYIQKKSPQTSPAIQELIVSLSKGSFDRAQTFIDFDIADLYHELLTLLDNTNKESTCHMISFCDKMAAKKNEALYQYVEEIFQILCQRFLTYLVVNSTPHNTPELENSVPEEKQYFEQLAKRFTIGDWLTVFDEINNTFRQQRSLHLEKKQTMITTLSLLQG